jgi:hypothetical protein
VLNLANASANVLFANEVPDLPEARVELEKYFRWRLTGEQKFGVDAIRFISSDRRSAGP